MLPGVVQRLENVMQSELPVQDPTPSLAKSTPDVPNLSASTDTDPELEPGNDTHLSLSLKSEAI